MQEINLLQYGEKPFRPKKETVSYPVLDTENATLTLEFGTAHNATSDSTDIECIAGSKYNRNPNKIVLGNVHPHPTEHEYLNKTDLDGNVITDQYNFNHQYSASGSDGNIGNNATRIGPIYTISRDNVDYFSPKGRSSSINNITTGTKLENNSFNLLNGK